MDERCAGIISTQAILPDTQITGDKGVTDSGKDRVIGCVVWRTERYSSPRRSCSKREADAKSGQLLDGCSRWKTELEWGLSSVDKAPTCHASIRTRVQIPEPRSVGEHEGPHSSSTQKTRTRDLWSKLASKTTLYRWALGLSGRPCFNVLGGQQLKKNLDINLRPPHGHTHRHTGAHTCTHTWKLICTAYSNHTHIWGALYKSMVSSPDRSHPSRLAE